MRGEKQPREKKQQKSIGQGYFNCQLMFKNNLSNKHKHDSHEKE